MKKKKNRSLKVAFKILLTLIILALLLLALKDFLDAHNHLVAIVNDQANTINGLQVEVTELQTQVDLQELKIEEAVNNKLTYQVPTVTIKGEIPPPEVEVPYEPKEPGTAPVIIAGLLTLAKAVIFRGMPVF